MSLFITFEGGEGSGKSSQVRALAARLARLAIPCLILHEPGGTPLGESVRRLLKRSRDMSISPLAELLLFNASRSQLVIDSIEPALREGKIVVCDRFSDSTLAYQNCGRGLDAGLIRNVNNLATRGLKPHLTFLLDVVPELGLSRKSPLARDRFELENLAFHQRVREGFLHLAEEEPARWVVIDSAQPKSLVSGQIWRNVSEKLRIGFAQSISGGKELHGD